MKTFDIERHATELEQDGYTVMHNVMPPSELEATKQAIEETLDTEEAIGRKYGLQNENLRHAFNVQGKHPHFYGMLLRNPAPIEVARRVLGEDMFAHDVVIRTPMPTGKKDATRLGGIIAEAPAGSVFLWDSSLWHTGGINSSDNPRYALIFYFQRWWIKGFNDSYRYVSPEVRAAMTEAERRIWGLEAGVPPNTHFRDMTEEQIAALTPEEKAVLNIAPF